MLLNRYVDLTGGRITNVRVCDIYTRSHKLIYEVSHRERIVNSKIQMERTRKEIDHPDVQLKATAMERDRPRLILERSNFGT